MLDDCLASVFSQAGGFDVEVIVHDDASTDGSLAVLARYSRAVVISSRENVGFCVANNRMVARARGKYVLLLNNDAALFPDALQSLMEIARGQERVGILTLPQYDWQSGELVDRGCLLDPFYNPVPNLDAKRSDVAMAMGACLFLLRVLWNELGGFPESIGSIGEDAYLCCVARLRGYPVKVAPTSGYRHRQGASFSGNRIFNGKLNTTYRRRALSERNKTIVMIVCTPTLFMWPLLAIHCAWLVGEGMVLALLKRDGRIWRDIYGQALGAVVREFGLLRKRRREVQNARRVSPRAYWHGFVWMPRKLSLLWRHGLPQLK